MTGRRTDGDSSLIGVNALTHYGDSIVRANPESTKPCKGKLDSAGRVPGGELALINDLPRGYVSDWLHST
jgi:hypothetical protein